MELIARLTQATLVRLNRSTGELEPRLAASWTTSADGQTWTFSLRPGVTFSDGEPLTSADVVFSFQALYDERVKSELGGSLRINGEPIRARAVDASTVVLVFPSPYGPGISWLDALPILPRHKLVEALAAGTFRQAWPVTIAPSEVVGLGPFVIQEYIPGRRLLFARNARFWGADERGRMLPYLDEIEVQFVPDQNTEVIRLQSGDVDLISQQVRFEDLAALMDLERVNRITLHDAGVSVAPDMFWFNLNANAPTVRDRPWLQAEDLRHAVSAAVDRQALVDTVFLGEATPIAGPITPGHGPWFLPDLAPPPFDPTEASRRLASLGLIDRNGDGIREDAKGQPARFSILTQKGHSIRERSAAIVQEHLRQVGLQVDVVALDVGSIIDRWSKGDYDAIYFAIEFDSFDPGRHPEFWLSSGGFHVWRPRQPVPATPWEARIDELTIRHMTSIDPAERRRIFAEAQRTLAAHVPVLYFAAPRIIIASSRRTRGLSPSVLAPHVLWNAERVCLASDRTARR